MYDFFNSLLKKLDESLFEILGLILPFMIFILLLFQPLLYIPDADKNSILKQFKSIFEILSKNKKFKFFA
jgi:hypothetical protein